MTTNQKLKKLLKEKGKEYFTEYMGALADRAARTQGDPNVCNPACNDREFCSRGKCYPILDSLYND